MSSISSTPAPNTAAACPPQVQTAIPWDAMPVPGVSVSDLSQEALDAFRTKAVASGHMHEEDVSVSNKALLRKLNLIDGSTLKQAAVLLFHPDCGYIQGAYMKVGKFTIHEFPDSFADMLQFSAIVDGPMFLLADKAIGCINARFCEKLPSRDTPPVPVQMIPDHILREVLINAIAHNDYAEHMPIQVSVHEDRINVLNYCTWPSDLPTGDEIYGQHGSIPRNPLVADVFYRAGMMEGWGSSFQRLQDYCTQTSTQKPKFRVKQDLVSVTVYCCSAYWSLLDLSLTGVDGLDPRLDMFNPEADFREISRRLSIPVETMIRMVSKMFPNWDFSKWKDFDDFDPY